VFQLLLCATDVLPLFGSGKKVFCSVWAIELMRLAGIYAGMYELQARNYR